MDVMPNISYAAPSSDGDIFVRWDRGEMTIEVSGDVIFHRISGYLEKSLVPRIKEPTERLIACGLRPRIFNDWWDMSGYDAEARNKLTEWTLRIRHNIASDHILVRSKIVSMGVSLANVALGGLLTVYTDRTEFAQARRRATLETSSYVKGHS